MSAREPRAKTIDALYAWVATEPDGGEGVCAALIGNTMYPLVGADIDRVTSLREYAAEARRVSGYPVRLVRFSRREDLEELA
jgi:hypothetical protein